jgi:hypothetical protein
VCLLRQEGRKLALLGGVAVEREHNLRIQLNRDRIKLNTSKYVLIGNCNRFQYFINISLSLSLSVSCLLYFFFCVCFFLSLTFLSLSLYFHICSIVSCVSFCSYLCFSFSFAAFFFHSLFVFSRFSVFCSSFLSWFMLWLFFTFFLCFLFHVFNFLSYFLFVFALFIWFLTLSLSLFRVFILFIALFSCLLLSSVVRFLFVSHLLPSGLFLLSFYLPSSVFSRCLDLIWCPTPSALFTIFHLPVFPVPYSRCPRATMHTKSQFCLH